MKPLVHQGHQSTAKWIHRQAPIISQALPELVIGQAHLLGMCEQQQKSLLPTYGEPETRPEKNREVEPTATNTGTGRAAKNGSGLTFTAPRWGDSRSAPAGPAVQANPRSVAAEIHSTGGPALRGFQRRRLSGQRDREPSALSRERRPAGTRRTGQRGRRQRPTGDSNNPRAGGHAAGKACGHSRLATLSRALCVCPQD